jgi:hypothetical protein
MVYLDIIKHIIAVGRMPFYIILMGSREGLIGRESARKFKGPPAQQGRPFQGGGVRETPKVYNSTL